jgi:hypothetical protein
MSSISSLEKNEDDSVIGPNVDRLPMSIMVTGFPIHLIGWNGIYERKTDGSFKLPSHELNLFGCLTIDILGVTIYYRNDKSKWFFKRDCDANFSYQSSELLGNWSTFTVGPVTSASTLWTSQFFSICGASHYVIVPMLMSAAIIWLYFMFAHRHVALALGLLDIKSTVLGFGIGFFARYLMS